MKKTKTNDRSSPLVSIKSNNNSPGRTAGLETAVNCDGTYTATLPKLPTGLFANGFPKLKKTTFKDKNEPNGK